MQFLCLPQGPWGASKNLSHNEGKQKHPVLE